MSIGMYEDQIYSILLEHREGLTIEDVSHHLQITRTTAARYLESLYHAGRAERRSLGPAKIYRASFRIQSSELLAILDEGVLELDSEGLIREVNPAFCKLFSLDACDLKGKSLIYSKISGVLSDDIIESLKYPPEMPSEGVILISGDRTERSLHYRIFPLQFPDGGTGTAFIVSDQTDLFSSKIQNKDIESEYQKKLSRIHSDLSHNLEKAKNTVRELSSRERTIRDLLQNVQVIILKINTAGRVVFCNHYASECANLNDGEQKPPIALSKIFPIFDKHGKHIVDCIKEVRDGVVNFSQWESPLLIHNQISSFIYSWNLISIKKGKGGASMILAGFDITDLIAREQQIIQSQKQMGWILDHLPDPTFAIDKRRHIILWNKQMESMTGLLSKEAIGRPIDACIPDIYEYSRPVLADLIFNRCDPEINAFFKEVQRDGEALTAETVAYRQDGSKRVYWVKVTPYYDEMGEIFGVIQSIRDITTIRENEEKNRDEGELLRGIAENALDNIMVINREGTILYVNQSLGRLIGISPEILIGSNISHVHEMKAFFPVCDRYRSVFLSGIPIQELFTIQHEGVEMLMDTTFIPEKDRSGLISSVLIVLKNVTSMREKITHLGSS